MLTTEQLITPRNVEYIIRPPAGNPGYPTEMSPSNWAFQYDILLGLPDVNSQQMIADMWYGLKQDLHKQETPSNVLDKYPGSQLIGYGWEWAVYEIPRFTRRPFVTVLKVPNNRHVTSPTYRKSSRAAVDVCRQYIKPFVSWTAFYEEDGENRAQQRKLPIRGKQILVDPEKASHTVKDNLVKLGNGFKHMLAEIKWMPDLQLEKTPDGWTMESVIINTRGVPKVHDFTAYFDEFRTTPALRDRNVERAQEVLDLFTYELAA